MTISVLKRGITPMAAPAQKTFITCAITGNLTRPEQSPHLPITPQQIADSALEARRRELRSRISMCAIPKPAGPRCRSICTAT
jgi:hypothetical protein